MTHNNPKIQGKFYPLQHEEWLRACQELTKAELEVLYYIRTIDPLNNGIEINSAEIGRQLSSSKRQVHRQTVSRALKELVAKKYLPDKYSFISAPADETERRIRDRLKVELSGEVEVITAVGRIDLLTSTEVIEIKNIDNWKEALGKILAYSSISQNISKRIHLFGRSDLSKLGASEATCSDFEITVTFEEVES